MLVGLERFDLRIPGCGSLKEKRHVVKGLTSGIRNKFNVSVAEVDHHDLWQRATLSVACVSRSAHEAEELADGAERWLASGDWVLVRCDRMLVSPDD